MDRMLNNELRLKVAQFIRVYRKWKLSNQSCRRHIASWMGE